MIVIVGKVFCFHEEYLDTGEMYFKFIGISLTLVSYDHADSITALDVVSK